jgi:hypothetical protein
MQQGQFIKWSTEDFSHVGMVVSFGERVTMLTEEGEMSFDQTDGKIEAVRRPSKFSVEAGIHKVKEAAAAAAKPTRKPKAGSKKELALEMFKKLDELPTRKEGIKMLVEQLEMTEAGASTYFAMIKKELN